ncbi:PEBP-like protein, partial [Exidia glandulosa HHB12029]
AQDTLESVKAAFESAGIVGDVIPTFDPSVLLTVTFTNPDGSPLTFTAGTLLTPAQAARRPTFSISPADPSTTFLVAEVDPDAPTPQSPTSAQIRHFLGPNFSVVGSTLANTTAALSDYRGPSPPAGSDPHRFVV